MTKKLNSLDIREVSLKIRAGVDNMERNDLRLTALLGFFHHTFLKVVKKLEIPLDTDVLNAVIVDHIQHNKETSNSKGLKATLEGYPLIDIFNYFNISLDSPNNLAQLVYLYGFSQGLLNRIMRKLGIDYQIPFS